MSIPVSCSQYKDRDDPVFLARGHAHGVWYYYKAGIQCLPTAIRWVRNDYLFLGIGPSYAPIFRI